MQKPWSFRAIEFLSCVQMGLAYVVISNGIFLLTAHVMRLYILGRLPISISGSIFWTLLAGLTEYNAGKGSPYLILSVVLTFLFEFIVSSSILFVLKTKSLVVIRRTAILALVLRISLRYLTNPVEHLIRGHTGYTFIFILGSILVVAFLFLKPVQHYIKVRSQRYSNSVGAD